MNGNRRAMTPVGAVGRALVAGAVGTLAMDLVWFGRYRRGGGTEDFPDWEFSGVEGWAQAPAPAQVGKRLVEGLFQRRLPDRLAPATNNLTHWAFGMLSAVPFGLLVGSLRTPRVWQGLPFGACVWGGGYVVLPAAGLYEPIWDYDAATLGRDLSAHLVYGLTTSAAFALLARGKDRS